MCHMETRQPVVTSDEMVDYYLVGILCKINFFSMFHVFLVYSHFTSQSPQIKVFNYLLLVHVHTLHLYAIL